MTPTQPSATPRTDALRQKHRHPYGEDELKYALGDYQDTIGTIETELASAKADAENQAKWAAYYLARAERAESALEREKRERTTNNSLLVGQRNTAEAELVEARANESLFREALENLADLCEGRELFPNACAAARRTLFFAKPPGGSDAKQP